MCLVFWGVACWGCPPEFTRLRVAVVSENAKIKIVTSKKCFLKNPKLVRNCIFRVDFESGFDKKK